MSSGLVPKPTPESAPFWEGTKAHELRLPWCADCDRAFFYPRSFCPSCGGGAIEWRTASGLGKLASYVINARPLPMFETEIQIIALVTLDEGPRLCTNLVGVDADPEALRLGMRLRVTFDERGDQVLPLFQPEEAAA